MLEPHSLTKKGVKSIGQIPGGEDARVRGLQVLVREHAIFHIDTSLLCQFDGRLHPDPDHYDIGGQGAPVGQTNTLDRT